MRKCHLLSPSESIHQERGHCLRALQDYHGAEHQAQALLDHTGSPLVAFNSLPACSTLLLMQLLTAGAPIWCRQVMYAMECNQLEKQKSWMIVSRQHTIAFNAVALCLYLTNNYELGMLFWC